MSIFFTKIINIFVKIFEQSQALYNIDIYSIIRVNKDKDINKFLSKTYSNSYIKWRAIYDNKDDLEIIHNIAFNYWIRSYSVYKINRNKNLNQLIYFLFLLLNSCKFIIYILHIFLSDIRIKKDTNYINDEIINSNQYEFVTYLNRKSYYSIIDKIKNEYIASLKFINLEISFKLFKISLPKKDKIKIYTIKRVFIYLIKYPFMLKYHKNLFKSVYMYYSFKENNFFRNKLTLCSEIYSMVSRSLCIASLDRHKISFYINHSKFDATPYDSYSLNREIEVSNINKIFKSKMVPKKVSSQNNRLPEILLQASDGCGTISSYEFSSYNHIMNALKDSKYNGKLNFKFHPANSKLSIEIKKFYCKMKFKDFKNIVLEFIHREKNIEYFARNYKLVISLDYSTSFQEIVDDGGKLIYFNHLKQRQVINKNNLIHSNKNFKMVTSIKELKKELEKFIYNYK